MDRGQAAAFWSAYCAAHPERAVLQDEPAVEAFGDSVELADELLELVLHGPKRAVLRTVDLRLGLAAGARRPRLTAA